MLADITLKVAVPLADGCLCNPCGRCEQFAVIQVTQGSLTEKTILPVTPQDPWLLPRWLGEMGVNLIIAGSIGRRAMNLFTGRGIGVIIGPPHLKPEDLVRHHLAGELASGAQAREP